MRSLILFNDERCGSVFWDCRLVRGVVISGLKPSGIVEEVGMEGDSHVDR